MYGPDELRARVVLLKNSPCEATVLQRQFLQQHEVHVVPDADGEDADLASGGLLGVVENLEGVGLPNGGLPIGQEDDEGHAVVFDVVVGHIVVEQLDAPLQGPVDVCAWGTPKRTPAQACVPASFTWAHGQGGALPTTVRAVAGGRAWGKKSPGPTG